MATQTVTYSCGHEDSISLAGPYKERERKLQWAQESGLCPACYKAEQNRKREAQERLADEMLSQHNLPTLQGSAKQVAWAIDIRRQIVSDPELGIKAIEGQVKDDPESQAQAKAAIDAVLAHDEASWWIDRRDWTFYELLRGSK